VVADPSRRPPASFQLGDWLVLPSQGRLVRGDDTAHLEPRTMDLLVLLAVQHGRVISKETILDQVWSDVIVGDAVVRRAVADLRRALGDDARHPRYIETIPKRGYRLLGHVEPVEAAGLARGSPPAIARQTPAADGADEPLLEPPMTGFECALEWGEHRHRLAEGVTVIGRDASAALQIPCGRVSRSHARIIVARGRATIEDLGSKNGTFVNQHRLEAAAVLSDGDQIALAGVVLVFRSLVSAETETADRSGIRPLEA
jgi:DNA-binding winged helix-turn-helix (wHTH) protein